MKDYKTLDRYETENEIHHYQAILSLSLRALETSAFFQAQTDRVILQLEQLQQHLVSFPSAQDTSVDEYSLSEEIKTPGQA